MLFVLAATVVNIIVMGILFTICIVLISIFADPESSLFPLWFGLTFIVSIGGSFYLYSLLLRKVTNTYDIEKYLDPIFFKKRSRGPNRE